VISPEDEQAVARRVTRDRPARTVASWRLAQAVAWTDAEAAVREVEVKYQVRDTEALLVALEARGIELGAPIYQDDQAYAPHGWSYGDAKLGVSFVRLRTVEDRHVFTLKRPAENALSCEEHETVVADRQQMHHAILAMGFCPTVRIVKTRRTATLIDLSLCVDEVASLGAFLELERMVPDVTSGEAVQAELAEFVASLDIEADRTDQTYDSLVRAALESV
jgi:adenylate cyclase class 2